MNASSYRGRFAPSPTGRLHFGSLVAAVGSYLCARAASGEWLVRIEDLDPQREVKGAAGEILRTLSGFGMVWDGPVLYQRHRGEAYEAALDQLRVRGLIYPCGCARREIQDVARNGVYPGICRHGLSPGKSPRALRVRVPDAPIVFQDAVQGIVSQNLAAAVGDFVLRRADGRVAYQLAVVVDDGEQAVTDVVRGADLLDSTARQIYLQRQLGLLTPRYVHLPIATNAQGQKLSKQTLAAPVHADEREALFEALCFLGHAPPARLRHARLGDIWGWAEHHWEISCIPCCGQRAAPQGWD